MAPEELDRVIAVATERYRAMTPADWRRIRREERRRARRAWLRRMSAELENAAAAFMSLWDTYV